MEKILYIVRHAKSSWDFPELSDFERPLNKRGKKDAPKMGTRLKSKGVKPDLVISSPAVRAKKTALQICKAIGFDREDIIFDQELYHAEPETILNIIREQPAELNQLMIFGHNPGFTEFANLVAGTAIDNIPTAGIVAVKFEVEWNMIRFGSGELLFFDYPKKEK